MDFLSSQYMPHGQCYFWQPELVWMHVMSDLTIAAAYFSMPLAIIWFLKKRQDIQFRALFYLAAGFILLCGVTHLHSVYVIWVGQYGVQALLKAITAVVSLITAMAMYHYLPKALAIPSVKQWQQLKEAALSRRQESESQSFFNVIADNISTGIMVVNRDLQIVMANEQANKIFQFDNKQLAGHNISQLIPIDTEHHHLMAKQFFDLPPTYQYPMAKGRTVSALTAQGESIEIELKLSQFQYFEQTMVAVTIEQANAKPVSSHAENFERTFRSLASVTDGAWEWNLKTNKIWWNEQQAKLMGLSPQTAPSIELWEQHIHPQMRTEVLDEIKQAIASGDKYDADYLGLSEQGDYQWFRTRGKVYFENGEALLMSGMLSNIHHTHELKAELNQKTEFLNRLINRSVAGIYVFDFNANKNIYINETYQRILGYSLQELNDIEDLTTLFHPDELDLIFNHMDEVKNEPQKSHEVAYRFKHKAGHWVWCLSKDSANEIAEDGSVQTMLGTFIDITDLKEKENTIKDWAASFYSIFNHAAVGIAQVSLDGNFVRVNQKLCDMWGYDEQTLLNKTFQEITHEDDLSKDLQKVNELLAANYHSYSIEKRYYRANGTTHWALLTVKMVRDEFGKPLHFISVIEDISERKSTEVALSESNKALEMFAFTASHDLQEPLRKIKTFASLIESRLVDKLDDPDARYELNRLSDAAERMSNMITSILELSRASNLELNRETVLLSAIVNSALETMTVLKNPSNLNIEVNNDLPCYVDLEQMSRVFVNLMTNAIKYQQNGKETRVTFSATANDATTLIHIQDNGPGIPEASWHEVFTPFKRLVGKDIAGSGMGLSICKQIMQQHHGNIRILPHQAAGLLIQIELPNAEGSL